MAQQRSEKQYNNFTKGLVTEVSPLTFPENAALDISNLILERSGKVSRRLGINYESGFGLKSTALDPISLGITKISYHVWPTPSGHNEISLGVVRVANKLWFVDTLTENPSANFILSGNPLTISGLGNSNIDVAIIHNNFVFVSKDLDTPIILQYISPTSITVTPYTVKVRDIWGIHQDQAIDARPTTLSDSHSYNLRNQGWSNRIYNTCNTAGIDSIQCTFNKMGSFPSNADIWTLGKIADLDSPDYQEYDPLTLHKNSIDKAPAAKGRFIIDIYNRGTSRKTEGQSEGLSALATLPQDRETGRISTIASFSGRLFYSGIESQVVGADKNSPNYAGIIFFTQVGASIDSLSMCYQEADPTSPEISDIIDTDGGSIHIPDISRVHKLLATRTSVLVFAQNGVWEIFGDTGGFTATSYQSSKVSNIGVESPYSIIETPTGILYWAKGGIFILTQDQMSGRYKVDNVSITTIQTLYNRISDTAKKYAIGFYEEIQNRVRWLYNDFAEYNELSYVNKYNKELIFDLTLGSFYVNELVQTEASPFVAAYAPIPKFVRNDLLDTVYVGDVPVQVGVEEVVSRARGFKDVREGEYKFLTITDTSFTLSEYNSTFFRDWIASNGTGYNYSSYLVTGYEIYQDMMRKKQAPYLVVALEKTESGFTSNGTGLDALNPSSCLVQAQWNWTNTATGNKWGTIFQAYRLPRVYFPSITNDNFDTGDTVIVTKNKLRGIGRALSLKFQSEDNKDMRILGWGTTLTMNGNV